MHAPRGATPFSLQRRSFVCNISWGTVAAVRIRSARASVNFTPFGVHTLEVVSFMRWLRVGLRRQPTHASQLSLRHEVRRDLRRARPRLRLRRRHHAPATTAASDFFIINLLQLRALHSCTTLARGSQERARARARDPWAQHAGNASSSGDTSRRVVEVRLNGRRTCDVGAT